MKTMPALLIQTQGLHAILTSFKGTILISKSVYQAQSELFKDREIIVYDFQQEPTTNIIAHLKKQINANQPLLAIGGGSVLDTAKLLTLHCNNVQTLDAMLEGAPLVFEASMPLTLVPTTAGSGSEASSVAVCENSQGTLKQGIVDDRFIPSFAVLDASLLTTLPLQSLRHSVADAITHAIESYLSVNATPLSKSMSLWALELLLRHYPKQARPSLTQSEHLLFGSHLAGLAFNSAGTAVVHALAYPLGAKTKAPHGLINGLLLPPTLSHYFKHPCAAKLKDTLEDIVGGVEALATFLALDPTPYAFNSLKTSDLQDFVKASLSITRLMNHSPIHFSKDDLLGIYQAALFGVDNKA